MNKSLIIFFVVFALITACTLYLYLLSEKKKKEKVKLRFRQFSKSYEVTQKDLRAVPRIHIPESIPLEVTLTDNKFFGLKGNIIDLSLTGFAIEPDFPLKKINSELPLNNVLVLTPISSFVIRKVRRVRIDHQIRKRLMAFNIVEIDEEEFKKMKDFILYADKFVKNEN